MTRLRSGMDQIYRSDWGWVLRFRPEFVFFTSEFWVAVFDQKFGSNFSSDFFLADFQQNLTVYGLGRIGWDGDRILPPLCRRRVSQGPPCSLSYFEAIRDAARQAPAHAETKETHSV